MPPTMTVDPALLDPIPPVPPLGAPSATDLAKEYVAGGTVWWYAQAARALPLAPDDLSEDFGLDLYDRMAREPQIYAALTVYRAAILEDGMRVLPAVTEQDDPDYALAQEIHAEAAAMLQALDPSLDDTLWDQLACIWRGNVVSEVVYGDATGVSGRPLRTVRAIKTKRPDVVAFAVDAYMNVVGILAIIPGRYPTLVTGQYLQPEQTPNLLPREKFCVLTFRPTAGDPRGTSLLRPVFDLWWDKRQLLPEYRKYLTQFAGPSLIGTTPDGARPVPVTDPDGNVQRDPFGNPVTVTAQQLMVQDLIAFRNGTAAAFPFGAAVKAIEMVGNGEAFLKCFARADQQITKAILTQTLTTEEGEHQSRSASEVHQDVQDTLIRQGKRAVERAYYRDVLRVWVRQNWGPQAEHLTPTPTLGVVEQHDQSQTMTGVAALMTAGYFYDQAQLAALDDRIGLPTRDLTQPPDIAGVLAPQPAVDDNQDAEAAA